MLMPRNSPVRKSLTRGAICTISSRSWVLAQPKAVMCSSVTSGSPNSSFFKYSMIERGSIVPRDAEPLRQRRRTRCG
jgi:hypothetical protein